MLHAMAIVLGVVIGAGIFKAPSLVAANAPSLAWLYALWLAGGLVTLVGALSYAELSSTYASNGGEYHFLSRAFGRGTALVYGWARFSVITTGSVALLGFVFGDYMSQLLPLGPGGSALYAGAAVLLLTAVNLRGIRHGAVAQSWLTVVEVAGLALIVLAGAWLWWQGGGAGALPPATVPVPAAAGAGLDPVPWSALGLAMVFVLLTFGGWNDAAYISADLKGQRAIVHALLWSVLAITVLYLLVNWAYVTALGQGGVAASEAVASDALAAAFGPAAGKLVAVMVALAALASMNATLIVGARTASALGRDWPVFALLSRWDHGRGVPPNALVVQALLALALVAVGLAFDDGFRAMVEYTAPVFWLFFLLTGLSLFRLRRLYPQRPRPFSVPLYPWLPALFCLSCAGMLWASLSYVRSQQLGGFNAAWIGVAVLGAGVLLLLLVRRAERVGRAQR
ncbi:MAG: amino acid permease [Rubrivivax sp.]|nr:amino acid permease [Rubrivivax sp.]